MNLEDWNSRVVRSIMLREQQRLAEELDKREPLWRERVTSNIALEERWKRSWRYRLSRLFSALAKRVMPPEPKYDPGPDWWDGKPASLKVRLPNDYGGSGKEGASDGRKGP